jgi:hypothetical protein
MKGFMCKVLFQKRIAVNRAIPTAAYGKLLPILTTWIKLSTYFMWCCIAATDGTGCPDALK